MHGLFLCKENRLDESSRFFIPDLQIYRETANYFRSSVFS